MGLFCGHLLYSWGEIPLIDYSDPLHSGADEADLVQIQDDLHYTQARQILRQLTQRLDLSDREQTGLGPLLRGLEQTLSRIEQNTLQIAVFGLVGRGKSSLLNALVGEPIFETGPLHGVTHQIDTSTWSLEPGTGLELGVKWRGAGFAQVELIDTPGIDEVAGEERETLAREVAQRADLILFVVAGDLSQVEYEALSLLRQASKPMLLVLNKMDQYPEADQQAIYETIRDRRVRELLSPAEIVQVAAAPVVTRAQRGLDGRLRLERQRGEPEIEPLRLRILEVLEREGKALVALNTLLYADQANEQIVARKMAIRDRAADEWIWNATRLKAVVVALNPVTVLDVLGGAAVDVGMVLSLSRLYGIAMTEVGAIALLQRIALGMGGLSVSELLANLGLGSLKSLLGLATPLSAGAAAVPYVSIAATQAAIAGLASYSIGQITKRYLANGATWGPEGPKVMIQSILDSLDEQSILQRLKGELSEKIGVNPEQRPD